MLKAPSRVEVSVGKRAALLKISGSFDHSAMMPEGILHQAHATTDRLAIVDLRDASGIDSEGLERLERFFASAEGKGVTVRVVAPKKSKVRRILDLVRFDRFLVVAGTVFEAVRFGAKQGKCSKKGAERSVRRPLR